MNRKMLIAIACLLCGSLIHNGCSSPGSSDEPQNLVFIIVDDLNANLGCYGHPVVQSPNIDKLAAEGIQFNHVYCNFAVCNPSRSSLLTGLRPETIGVLNNRTTIQSVLGDRVTLPNLFKLNGYHTIGIGKIFHSWMSSETEHDDLKAWDEVYHFETTELGSTGEGRNMTGGALAWCSWMATNGTDLDQRDGQSTMKAVEFINSDHEKPFFLALGIHKPHDPFVAPKKYFDLYPIEVCKIPEIPEGWTPPYNHTLPSSTKKIFDSFTDQDRLEFIRSYYAGISFMDAQVGLVMQALEEQDLLKNTVVVFMGDHGYHLGEHEWWNKVSLYEHGLRAPFIVYTGDPDTRGTQSDALIEFIDIYPTLASLSGLENIPEYLEGSSFEAVIKDPSRPFKEAVFATIYRGEIQGRSVKTDQWRYTEWDKGEKGIELYDQVKDPDEYTNLAEYDEYEEIVNKMMKYFPEQE